MAVRADYSSFNTPTAAEWNTYILNGGLQLLSEYEATALTGSISCSYAFAYPTAQFSNYRVVISDLFTTTGVELTMKMLSGTVPYTTLNYDYSYRQRSYLNTTGTNFGANQNFWRVGVTNNLYASQYSIDFNSPQWGVFGFPHFSGGGGISGLYTVNTSGVYKNAVNCDGFILYANNGAENLKAIVQVYGYRATD